MKQTNKKKIKSLVPGRSGCDVKILLSFLVSLSVFMIMPSYECPKLSQPWPMSSIYGITRGQWVDMKKKQRKITSKISWLTLSLLAGTIAPVSCVQDKTPPLFTSWHGNVFCITGPVIKGPVMWNFDAFFVVSLGKQSGFWWFEMI